MALVDKLLANGATYGTYAISMAHALAQLDHPVTETMGFVGAGLLAYGTSDIVKKGVIRPLERTIANISSKCGKAKTYGAITALALGAAHFVTPVKNGLGYLYDTGKQVATAFSDSQNQTDFTKQWEGFEPKVYLDTKGFETIGWGTCIDPKIRASSDKLFTDSGLTESDILAYRQGKPMSDELAETLITLELQDCEKDAKRIVDNYGMLPTQAQHIVVDMVYNVGPAGFRGFEDTIKALESRDWEGVAQNLQDSVWFEQTKRRARAHVKTFEALHVNQWYNQAFSYVKEVLE